MPGKLDSTIAIITGADSGIGAATALLFAREGADIVVTYHSDERGGAETVRGVREAGRRALLLQCDIRDEASVAELFARTRKELGPADILVNNAGINLSGKPVADMESTAWDNEIRTNLYGAFYCIRAFLRLRREHGDGGVIVNVSSVHEEIPFVGAAGYDAAKGGMRNLTRTVALEVAGKGTRVNVVAPGMILTPMNREAIEDPEVLREREQNIPMRRAGLPDDVARVILFLASDDSSYVTGQTFWVDGGLSINQGQGA